MSTDFAAQVRDEVKAKYTSGTLSEDERSVVKEIYRIGAGRVSQAAIAAATKLGIHPQEEDTRESSQESTLRRVRQVIRTLRVKHGVPILADRGGYYLPASRKEAQEYLARMEAESKARAKASLETYRAMKTALGLESGYFEQIIRVEEGTEVG